MMQAASVFSHDAWSAIVGKECAERTCAVEFRDRLIVIETDSSAWAQQVAFLSDRIVRHTQAHRICIRVAPHRYPRVREGGAE